VTAKALKLLFTRPHPALFVDGVVVLRDDAFSRERYESTQVRLPD